MQDFSDGIRLLGPNLLTWHPEKKIQALQMVVHSADIANPAKPLKFSQQWVDRVLREFFAQVSFCPLIQIQSPIYWTGRIYCRLLSPGSA